MPQTSAPSLPRFLLHLEGALLFLAAVVAYAHLRANAWLFIGLLLVPDVSMLGYLRDARLGSLIYNLAHHYAPPLVLFAFGLAAGQPLAVQGALIWLAHIGVDRALGYGLKYPTTFKDTHMQHV
jgi:hypothetical protein